jgi:YVTN family beta-propeller protein
MAGRGLASLGLVLSVVGGIWAAGLKITPSPALLVLSKDENALAIVDPATFKVLAKVPTGTTPHEVAASVDGKLAVVTNYGAHQDGTTLTVIDLVGQKEIHTVELEALKGYFTAEGSNAVGRYDPATNRVDWTFTTSQERTHMLVVSRDGNTIFTANVSSNTVTCLKHNPAKDVWGTTQIPAGKGPEGIDMSPDGKEVWAANSGDGTVSVIDAQSKKVTQTIDVHTKRSNRLKFTPDGKQVLISDLGNGDLLVVDVATLKEVKRIHLGSSAEGIQIQPEGTRAFVAVSGDNQVAVVDLKTLEVVSRFEVGKDPDGMAWVN